MKRISLLMGILTICMTGAVEASLTFDFEGTVSNPLSPGDSNFKIGNYMSELYPGVVTTEDMVVAAGFPLNQFAMLSDTGDDMGILFSTPITSVQFDLAVYDDGDDGTYDFELRVYDATYGDMETPNPGAQIGSTMIFSGTSSFINNTGLISFSSPVSLLTMADSGQWDIAIDNLKVEIEGTSPILPAPGAILLGGIGVGLVGWLRTRKRL